MFKPDHYFFAADPEILATTGEPNPTLRFQVLEDKGQGRYGRSGKFVHLEIANDVAMQLLASLQAYQKAAGLEIPPEPPVLHVPPVKGQH